MRLGALLTTLLLIACGGDSHAGTAGAGSGGAASGGSSGASASGGSTSGGSGGMQVAGMGGGGSSGGAGGSGGTVSGGSGGAGGAGSGGGAGSAGGSGSDAGTDSGVASTAVCPMSFEEAPSAGSTCEGQGQCTHSMNGQPGCTSVWECFESKWVLVVDGGCFGPSGDLCPPAAEDLAQRRCWQQTCIYAPDSVCACEQPCGGIEPDPETLVMKCSAAPSAACVREKQAGGACTPIGTVCAPACCGAMWTCTAQGWRSDEVLCPP